MSRRQIFLLSALAALAILVVWAALRTRQPPILPADEAHERFVNAETCLGCHGPGTALPQGPNHPLGNDCVRCHGFAK